MTEVTEGPTFKVDDNLKKLVVHWCQLPVNDLSFNYMYRIVKPIEFIPLYYRVNFHDVMDGPEGKRMDIFIKGVVDHYNRSHGHPDFVPTEIEFIECDLLVPKVKVFS